MKDDNIFNDIKNIAISMACLSFMLLSIAFIMALISQ